MQKDLIKLVKDSEVDIDSIRHLFWKDEVEDLFLLTRVMGLYWYNINTLTLLIWNYNTKVKLRDKGLIFDEIECDDGLLACKANIASLPYLLSINSVKKRFRRNSLRLKKLVELLGHKIIPFRIESEVKGEMPENLKNYQFKKKSEVI